MNEFGFRYCEEIFSPDGNLRVVYGYSDGEKTPLIIEPRVFDTLTGEIVIDLWRIYCNGTIEFGKPNELNIKIENPRSNAIICSARIDLANRTFSLAGSPQKSDPLKLLRQKIIELRGS